MSILETAAVCLVFPVVYVLVCVFINGRRKHICPYSATAERNK
jgi:hypothetical protein